MQRRRDKKNRLLNTGESQRSDGRYVYSYKDTQGKSRWAYSWKLVDTDTLPAGVRNCESLRSIEKRIQRDIDNEVISYGDGMKVIDLVKKYVALKRGVRNTTRAGYQTVINILEKEKFGHKRIDKIKISDAKEFLIMLQEEKGRSYSSIHNIRGVLRPAFQMAYEDMLIRKNPFEFQLHTVVVNNSVKRDALTRKQERQFLKFISEDEHYSQYYEVFYILFNTGMRISEFCGLTIKDFDIKEKTLNISKQLQYVGKVGGYIEETKTDAGKRVIPLADDVVEAFRKLIAKRNKCNIERMIEGYSGFLVVDKNGRPYYAYQWEKIFQRAVDKHNSIFKQELPNITPHIARHTFITNKIKSGMNPVHVSYYVGHADLSVTIGNYTHIHLEDVQEEMKRVENIG